MKKVVLCSFIFVGLNLMCMQKEKDKEKEATQEEVLSIKGDPKDTKFFFKAFIKALYQRKKHCVFNDKKRCFYAYDK